MESKPLQIKRYDVPILLLIFNRPDCTEKLLNQVRLLKPSMLFVGADGPRAAKLHEKELCDKTRAFIKTIDWDCNVSTLFRDENLGCKDAVSGAIKWFFSQVSYGIILEDDCIPDTSFFSYCEELLIKYKDDERIGMICGRNELGQLRSDVSYEYATAGSIWGWASWDRVIKNYDPNDKNLLVGFKENIWNATMDKFEKSRLFLQLKWTLDGSLNTWDYQLHVLMKLNSMLYIIPKYNLIQNVGFGENATHTTAIEEKRSSVPTKSLNSPLSHPKWLIPNRALSKCIVRADSNNMLIWLYVLLSEKTKDIKARLVR